MDLCLKLVCQPTQDPGQTKWWWLKDHLPKMDQSRNQATETGTKRKTSLDATMQNILWIKKEDQTLIISKPNLRIIPLSSVVLQKEKTSLGEDTQGQKKTIYISYFPLLMFLAYLEGRRMRLDWCLYVYLFDKFVYCLFMYTHESYPSSFQHLMFTEMALLLLHSLLLYWAWGWACLLK